jgi:hypothetical protein
MANDGNASGFPHVIGARRTSGRGDLAPVRAGQRRVLP